MSDAKIAMVDPKRSRIAMVMAAALAMFRDIKGTKPRTKGFDGEGKLRFRGGTGARGGRGRSVAQGGTPEANLAVYRVESKFLHSHRRRREAEMLAGKTRNAVFGDEL